MPQPNTRTTQSPFNFVFGVATILMSALAAGAIWSVVAIVFNRELSWLAVPIGISIAQISRMNGPELRWLNALLAATFTLLACGYAQYLLAAVRMTRLLGIPLKNALMSVGPDMAFALARVTISAFDLVWIVAGTLIAAIWAWYRNEAPKQLSHSRQDSD